MDARTLEQAIHHDFPRESHRFVRKKSAGIDDVSFPHEPQRFVRKKSADWLAGAMILLISLWPGIEWLQKQTQQQPAMAQAENTPSRRLEINLTISDPSDLKVSEGQAITRGQVLSDRVKERQRLERQKVLVLNAIDTVSKSEVIAPPEPLPVPEPQALPPHNLDVEEAQIESASLKLTQARRAYNLALQSDPFLQPTAAVETARHEWEMAQRRQNQAQEILVAISQLRGIAPSEIEHRRFQLEESMRESNQREAIYHQRQGELRMAQQARVESLERLQDAIATAESQLTLAQSQYAAAKNAQSRAEYNHRIMAAQRVEESNRAKQELAAQQAAYQNRLLAKEQQLFQYQQRLDQIENELNQLAQVRSPYNGTIQRIRIERQDNNSLSVTVTLLPTHSTGGDRPITPNPFSR